MEEIEQKTYIHKVLDIVINQFKDLKEDQKQLNESVDKIVTWLIGFIFIFIGIIFSNSDKIPLVESKLLIIFLVVTIIIGLISRIFSYLFNLSYASNLSALEMIKHFSKKN
ncbi:MAG: hypothetical protein AB8B78_11910 [Polaribacter sp.]